MNNLSQNGDERKAAIIENFKLGRHRAFVMDVAVLNSKGIKNSEIADALGITPTHLSRIINQGNKVSEKLSNLLADKFKLRRYSFFTDENMEDTVVVHPNLPLVDHRDKNEIIFSESEVAKIKEAHKREIDHLNTIIDHLRFIIEEYKRLEKK